MIKPILYINSRSKLELIYNTEVHYGQNDTNGRR